MNFLKRIPAACILICLALLISVADACAGQISLKSEAAVASEFVYLSDLATVADASPDELAKLKNLKICAAPPAGESQIISAADVLSALTQSEYNSASIRLSGASEVVVKRVYALLPAEAIIEAFSAHVAEKTGWMPGSFSIQPPKNLASIPVPPGKRTLIVSTSPAETFSHSVIAAFDILIDDKSIRNVSHRFNVEQYVETLVAVSKLRRGQPVYEGEFRLARVERSRIDGEPVADIAQLEGKKALRTIYPDTPIAAEFFAPPPIVKRGENAVVVWEGSGFSVVTKGVVLDSGCTGDIVRVRLVSKRIAEARVTDAGTLEIVD